MVIDIDIRNAQVWQEGDVWTGTYNGRLFSGPMYDNGPALAVGLAHVGIPYNNRRMVNSRYIVHSVKREVLLPTAPVSLVTSAGATWVLSDSGWTIVEGKSNRKSPNLDDFTVLHDAGRNA